MKLYISITLSIPLEDEVRASPVAIQTCLKELLADFQGRQEQTKLRNTGKRKRGGRAKNMLGMNVERI